MFIENRISVFKCWTFPGWEIEIMSSSLTPVMSASVCCCRRTARYLWHRKCSTNNKRKYDWMDFPSGKSILISPNNQMPFPFKWNLYVIHRNRLKFIQTAPIATTICAFCVSYLGFGVWYARSTKTLSMQTLTALVLCLLFVFYDEGSRAMHNRARAFENRLTKWNDEKIEFVFDKQFGAFFFKKKLPACPRFSRHRCRIILPSYLLIRVSLLLAETARSPFTHSHHIWAHDIFNVLQTKHTGRHIAAVMF